METEQDFDLQILKEKEGASRYRVNVIQSPAGEAAGEFTLAFTESEKDELFRGLGQVRKATRGAASPEIAKAREFGTQLFERVFSGDIRDCLNNSRGRTQATGHGLRIRLRMTQVPELLDLPWELLFDRHRRRFVALDEGVTLVRHLPVAEPVIPMRVEAPLRVLVAISNPRRDLKADLEWTKLSDALADLKRRGLVEVERLQPATFDGLEAKLRTGTFHILHFVGHGAYDASTESGFLSFELKPTGEKRVGATRLSDLLRPFRSLRLVVLNACEGGRTSREDAFAGVAQSLVQSAIPAVVAMQFPVTDAAAIVFAGAFYAGLAAGRSVDLALADARREVNLKGEEGDIEWATPVLYMRGSGALFDVGEAVPPKVEKLAKGRGLTPATHAAPITASGSAFAHKEQAKVVESAHGTISVKFGPYTETPAWKPGTPFKLVLSNQSVALFLNEKPIIGDLDSEKWTEFSVPAGVNRLQARRKPAILISDVFPFDIKGGESMRFTVEHIRHADGREGLVIKPVLRGSVI